MVLKSKFKLSRMRKVGSLILLISFFLGSSALFSQTYQSFQSEKRYIIERTKWKIGPFRLFPRLTLRNVGYDDNVYYQREDYKVRDYTGTLSPEIKISVLFRNLLIFSLKENPEYVYYLREDRERRWNNTFSPEFKLLLFRRFVLGGNYTYQNRRRRATSEFDVRANEKRQSYKGSLFYETPRLTLLGVTVSTERITYEDVTLPGQEIYLSRLLNRDEKRIKGQFYYRIFSQSFFFFVVQRSLYEFLHPQSFWRNSHSYSFTTGIRFPEIGKVRGTISLGYKELIPRDKSRQGFKGIIGNTSLQWRFWRLILKAKLTRDYPFSIWTNNIYFIYNHWEAGCSFYLSQKLRVDYSLSLGHLNYPVPFVWKDQEILRKDKQLYQIGGFVVRLKRNLGVGLQVVWWQWTSNLPGVDRNRLFFGGYITQEF